VRTSLAGGKKSPKNTSNTRGERSCSSRGSATPAGLAMILVTQMGEGLSDREGADAVRGRIDRKYAPPARR